MDVAFVNRMLGITRGGGEIWDLRIAEALADQSIDVTFYVGEPLTSELPEPLTDFETVEVPTPHLRDIAYSAPRGIAGLIEEVDSAVFRQQTARALADADHDLVHVNFDPRFRHLTTQLDCPVTIKLNGPPHSLFYDTLHPWTDSYDFLSAFDTIVATGITPQKIRDHITQDVLSINPGVDTDVFEPDGETLTWDGPTVLYVGRFVPVKNLELLLAAFATVHEEMPTANLVLVGDGPLRESLAETAEILGISDAVQMPGYVDQNDLPPYYRGSDLFALSSRFDNHPITLLEAMATGTPVVAPTVGSIPEMVDDGEVGHLYSEGSEDELTDRLQLLLGDKGPHKQMGQKRRKAAVERYTWSAQAGRLADVFQALVE
jgi:glycosyltransferase involved in cell wall biosynthesis